MESVRQALLEEFKDDEKVRFLGILMRVAGADDVSPSERNHLQPVAEWIGASEDELTRAVRIAHSEEFDLDELVSGFRHGDQGLLLFRECCAVVWVDMAKTASEESLLNELGLVLGISEEARQILDSPIVCSPEGDRRFLTLLRGTYSSWTED
ncbi:MAG: hypothetical protein WC423_24040 [Vulcanimicrobiota bacterium]